jgi:hypothetical protein
MVIYLFDNLDTTECKKTCMVSNNSVIVQSGGSGTRHHKLQGA